MNARDYLYWERMAAKRSGDDMNLVNGWGTGNDITADGNKSSNGIYSTSILTDKNKYLFGLWLAIDERSGIRQLSIVQGN